MIASRSRFRNGLLVFCLLFSTASAARAQEQDKPPPLPDYLSVSIQDALERGKSYLLRSQQSTGTWSVESGHKVGYAALPGLTLLELGVDPKHPVVLNAANFVRSQTPKLDNTYEVALAVLFLDRLGDPRDKIFVQALTARLIAGQTHTGGWSYKVPILPEKDTITLLRLIRTMEPLPMKELLGGHIEGLNNPFVKNWPKTPEAAKKDEEQGKEKKVTIPKELELLPVMNEFGKFKLVDPEGKGQQPVFGTTDNSTTQFALLALWAGRRHGIPVTRTGTLAFMRYHTSQNSNGGWGYPYVNGGGPNSVTMINPGLLGLALGHGIVREMGLTDEPAVDQDPRIHRAFLALSQHIGDPVDRIKDIPMPNLYFLWSVERVAILYNMHLIGTKDWYRWGAEALVANQNPESGHWEKSNYAGGESPNAAPINTSFALLFLKRANLAEDLSKYLTFSPKKLNDSIIKLSPKPAVAKKPQPKPEPKPEPKPVVVAEAKPAVAPTPVVAPPPETPPRIATPPPLPEPPASGGMWWVWLLIGLGALLIVGGVLAILLMGSGGNTANTDDDEEPRPRKKKPKRR